MNLGEIVSEVGDRGFDDLVRNQPDRLKRWVNDSYREVCDEEDWPFLEDTEEGAAPLTIADLGHVLSVSDVTGDKVLDPLDRRRVVEGDPALDDTGGAGLYWYREGMETIRVWPGDASSTYVVRYALAVPDLAADADEPIVPVAYQGLIVDGAVVRCMKNRKNYEAAQFERQEWERGLRRMRHALLKVNHDRPRRVKRTGGPEDYLG